MPHNPLEGQKPELNINLHDGSEEQVSIIIPHYNRDGYLNILIQSIVTLTFNNNYEIIVVDNASGPASQDFLNDLTTTGIKVVKNEKNLHWGPAINKGVAAADKNSKYFVFLHNDIVVLNPSWLDLMISVCESQKSGMVSLQLKTFWLGNEKVDFLEEWCMMATRECWNKCGPFPDQLPIIGASLIPTLRAQKHGFKPMAMKNNVAHHYKTFSLDISEYERLAEQAQHVIPQLLKEVNTETRAVALNKA